MKTCNMIENFCTWEVKSHYLYYIKLCTILEYVKIDDAISVALSSVCDLIDEITDRRKQKAIINKWVLW